MPRTDADIPFAIMTLDSGEQFKLDRFTIHARIVRGKIRYTIWEQPTIRRPHGESIDGSCKPDTI